MENPNEDSSAASRRVAMPRTASGETEFEGRRRGLMLTVFVGVLFGIGLQFVGWRSSGELHTAMESVAMVLAAVVGVLTLVRFYANGSAIHLYVGAGFLGTAVLDASCACLTSSFFAEYAKSSPASLSPSSWCLSQTFLGVAILLSLHAQQKQDQRHGSKRLKSAPVYLGCLLLTLVCFLLLVWIPLPSVYPSGFVGRWEELLPAGLFAFAAWRLMRRGEWRAHPFEYWLLASVLLGTVCQTVVMTRSSRLFDAMFDLAHVMKITSYGLVLYGVIQTIHILYRSADRMTRQLAASETKLRGLIDQSFNFIGLLTTDGILIDGNRTALDSAGVAASEVIGKPFHETPWWTHSSELQERLKLSISLAARGETDRFEATHRATDGSLIYVDFSIKPLRDSSGEIIFLMPEGRDITDRKHADQALRTAELRLQNALDGAEVGIWDWNVVTDDVFVSPQLTQQLGSDEPWTTLDDWISRLHPDDQETAESVIADYLTGEIPEYENTFRLRHVDGGWRWILSRGQLFRDEDGQPQRMVGIYVDITERIEQQRQLAEQAQELKASNQELEQFAYVASHDLQEPLRAISGYVQLLKNEYGDVLDDKALKFIDRSVEGTQRMHTLIADLLDYSRVSRKGKEFARTDLSECVRGASLLLDAFIEESGTQIEVGELPVVMADSSQMIRLLQNLISNSIKYRGDTSPEIRISSERRPGSDHWTIRVEDNGIGIAPEHADRVFVIFQRLHSRKRYEGTGIGLAVCRRIVERHGGKIHVESDGHCGSTFVFTLPVVSQTEPDENLLHAAHPAGAGK